MTKALRIALRIAQSIVKDKSNEGERLLRLMGCVRWQIRKRIFRRPMTVRLFNGHTFIASTDDDVSAALIYFRIPDYDEISLIRRHIHSGTLVDVGANVGSVALLLADCVQHAVLFEPNPDAANRARKNLAINGLRFDVVALALSDTEGEIAFEDRGGVSSTNQIVTSSLVTSFPVRLIGRTTLDRFLVQNPPPSRVSIIKIDVEGHENQVLRGMMNCLASSRPLVMFEYLQRTDLEETREVLKSVAYAVAEICNGQLRLAARSVRSQQNLFAIPIEQMSSYLGRQPAL